MNLKNVTLLLVYLALPIICNSQIKINHLVIRPSLSFGIGILNSIKYKTDYLPNKDVINYNYSLADVIENPIAAIDVEFFKLNNFVVFCSYGTAKAQIKTKTQWGSAVIDVGSSSILLTNYGIGLRKNINLKNVKNYFGFDTRVNLATNYRTNYSIEFISVTKTTSGILFDSAYAKNNSLTKMVFLLESNLTYHHINKKNRENYFLGIGINLGFKPIFEGYNYYKTDYYNYYLDSKTYTNGSLVKFKVGFPIDVLKIKQKFSKHK